MLEDIFKMCREGVSLDNIMFESVEKFCNHILLQTQFEKRLFDQNAHRNVQLTHIKHISFFVHSKRSRSVWSCILNQERTGIGHKDFNQDFIFFEDWLKSASVFFNFKVKSQIFVLYIYRH